MQTIRNRILLAKEEASYGVDPTPVVGSNAIEAKNVKIGYVGDKLERDNIRGNISPVSPVIGKRYIEISFEAELKGSGTRGAAGKLGDLLEACSFAETVTAGSSVVYKPTSSSQKSITIYLYDIDSASSVLHKITGAVGSVNIKGVAGQYATLEFNFRGKYNLPTTVAIPSAPTYETTTPPVVENAAFTLNGVTSLVVQDVGINIDNNIAERDDISSANGIAAFTIVGRKPSGSFNPEAVLVSTYDFYSDWVGSTQRQLSLVVGSVSGNKCTITCPKVTIDNIADGEREGVLTKEIPFSLGQNTGNDEIELKFE
jgi:hypothetical protein